MLNAQENDALTRVGKGTPMGELMRRYWQPIAASGELDERPTKSIRLLGEDLVLYRDRSGTLGLIDALCPHRRVDLSYGIPEENGLRCMYHGWMYDETGQCIEQPFEETVHPDGRFKEKVKINAYPVQVLAGLVFAYLGPLPAPFLPQWEPLTWGDAVRDIAISHLPCNWLQCQENSVDPVHVEWMHVYFGRYSADGGHWSGPKALLDLPSHQKIGFDEFEHGIIKRRVFEGYTEDDDDWKEGHPIFFPNILMVGSQVSVTFQWRVPIDDEHTLHISQYIWHAAPGTTAPKQDVVPFREVALKDEDGRWITDLVFNQDYMAWMTQGPIANRTKEVLGESDRGVIMFRKQLRRELNVIADGGEPMNVFRDAERAACIIAPLEHVKFGMRRPKKYIPGESGFSADSDKINEVIGTWNDLPEMANAPGSGEGE